MKIISLIISLTVAAVLLPPQVMAQSQTSIAPNSVGCNPSSSYGPVIGCYSLPTGFSVSANNLAPGGIFIATAYVNPGTGLACGWSATTDNGPCLQAAISAAAAVGGGTVLVPASGGYASCYGLATPVTQTTSGVSVLGYGVGYPGANGTTGIQSATRFCWLSSGSTSATMFEVNGASTTKELTNVSVIGITFDCRNNTIRCFHANDVSNSRFEVGVANAGNNTSGAAGGGAENGVFDTWCGTSCGGNGNQNDYFKLYTASTNYASGWRLDAGGTPGNRTTTNTSQDVIEDIFMSIGHGDGFILGDVDNMLSIGPIRCQGGCTNGGHGPGMPVIVTGGGGTQGHTSPNGVSTNGSQQRSQTRILHTSTGVYLMGYQDGAPAPAPGGGNTGTEAVTTITATTSVVPPQVSDNDTLTFGTTTGGHTLTGAGVTPGMTATCNNGSAATAGPLGTGVPYLDPALVVTATTVQFLQPVSAKYAPNSNITCTFGYGIQPSAAIPSGNVAGTYVVTYSGSWSVTTAPSGGNTGACTINSGSESNVVQCTDFVLPLTKAAPSNGDTFTITVEVPATAVSVLGTDQGNNIPLAAFQQGAWGWQAYAMQQIPSMVGQRANPSGYTFCLSAFYNCESAYANNNGQGLGDPVPQFNFLGAIPAASTIGGGVNININNYATGAIDGQLFYGVVNCLIACNAGSNILDLYTESGGVLTSQLSLTDGGNLTLGGNLITGVYSAAGTPLPTCNAGHKYQMATVSDATGPTYNATYTSGGAVVTLVLCNGTNWTTH